MIRENETKRYIIHCSTKQEWIDAVKKLFNVGYSWSDDDDDIREYSWDDYTYQSCIYMKETKDLSYCEKKFFENDKYSYPYPIISAREFIKFIQL